MPMQLDNGLNKEERGQYKIPVYSAIFILVLLGGGSSGFPSNNLTSPIHKMSWIDDQKSKEKLERLKSPEISLFVEEILNKPIPLLDICEFAFWDLNNDKKLELVGIVSAGGTTGCSGLVVIGKNKSEFKWDMSSIVYSEKLEEMLSDLDGDGAKELKITQMFGSYKGGRPTALWTDIYKWGGEKLELVSGDYPEFYKEKIQKLKKQILEENEPDRKAAFLIEMEKANRFLNPNSRVGIERAKEYVKSGLRERKVDAIIILEDIGDSESLEIMKSLSQDNNSFVAKEAKRALKRIEVKKFPQKLEP